MYICKFVDSLQGGYGSSIHSGLFEKGGIHPVFILEFKKKGGLIFSRLFNDTFCN